MKLYTRLRAIESEIDLAPDADRITDLQAEVGTIERDCSQLPLPVRFADMHFRFALPTKLVRRRLLNRLDELQRQP